MSDEISVTPVRGDDPYGDFSTPDARPEEYQPWKRPLTYVVFALGMNAAGVLFGCLSYAAVVLGWFALGLGIAAVVLARKEIDRCPRAEQHPFIKWGRRTGMLGIFIGPLTAIVWIVVIAAIGLRF